MKSTHEGNDRVKATYLGEVVPDAGGEEAIPRQAGRGAGEGDVP